MASSPCDFANRRGSPWTRSIPENLNEPAQGENQGFEHQPHESVAVGSVARKETGGRHPIDQRDDALAPRRNVERAKEPVPHRESRSKIPVVMPYFHAVMHLVLRGA